MSSTRRGRVVGLLVSVAILVAACSSSSDSPDGAEAGSGTGNGSLDAALTDQATTPGQTTTPGQAGAPSQTGGAANGAARPGGAAPSQPAAGGSGGGSSQAAAPAPAGGPVRASAGGELQVGLYYAKAVDNFPSVGVATGDGLKMAQAVVDWINANGGGGGRKIKLVTYGALITEFGPTPDQAACTKFTKDNPVPVAVNAFSATDPFYECMADRGVPVINSNNMWTPSHEFHMRHRGLIFSVTPTPDREGASLAAALDRHGYFRDPGMTLGLLHGDDPRNKAAAKVFLARVAALGVKPKTIIATDDSQASMQNAVVRFRSDGVTHVALLGTTGFISQAAAQAYFPRYGVRGTYTMALNNPPEALRGAVGAGFAPAREVNEAQEEPTNASMKLCRKIMRDAGQDSDARFVHLQIQGTCATLFLLKAILDRAPSVDAAGLRAGAERIGNSWVPALIFSAFLGPNRYDAADTYRILLYDSGCRCFRYEGPLTRMPTLAGQS